MIKKTDENKGATAVAKAPEEKIEPEATVEAFVPIDAQGNPTGPAAEEGEAGIRAHAALAVQELKAKGNPPPQGQEEKEDPGSNGSPVADSSPAAGISFDWLDEFKTLNIPESREIKIEGHNLTFAPPKMTRLLKLAPIIQGVFDELRKREPKTIPMGVFLSILRSWNTPDNFGTVGQALCEALDLLLGLPPREEGSWVAENLSSGGIGQVMAYLKDVIQVQILLSFIGPLIAKESAMHAALWAEILENPDEEEDAEAPEDPAS